MHLSMSARSQSGSSCVGAGPDSGPILREPLRAARSHFRLGAGVPWEERLGDAAIAQLAA
jgi:hypothetical protein